MCGNRSGSNPIMKKVLIIFGVILLCLASVSDADAKQRSSKSVRKQQQLTEQKIKKTDRQIKENERQLKTKLNDLNRLQAESQSLTATIARLQLSIDSIEIATQATRDSIAVLDSNLTNLKIVFADVLRNSRRSRTSMTNLAFIFSSNSFTQAFRRANALKQFSKWRERKVDQINEVKAQLDERERYLDTLMVQNRTLVQRLAMQQNQLAQRKSETDKIISSLKGKNKDLKKLLRKQQKQATDLDRELERIIQEEQRRAEEERRKAEQRRRAEEERRKAEEAKKKAQSDDKAKKGSPTPEKVVPKPDKKASDTPKLSSDFAANKGRLSYPVNPYKIVKRFGRQQHPLHKNVMTDNAGIDMETMSGAQVACVFDGEVSAIICPDGYNNVVLVRHGNYLTVYANLGTLSVRRGDKVRTGQTLGTVFVDTSDNNRSILHFEIRNAANTKSITKENPESWLR